MIVLLILIGTLGSVGKLAADTVSAPAAPRTQSPEYAAAKSEGCLTCHTASDAPTMHTNPGVVLGCTDCHGGDPSIRKPDGAVANRGPVEIPTNTNPGKLVARNPDPAYRETMDKAHVLPRFPDEWNWPASAKPMETYTLLNKESPEFVRFMNPSDYRVVNLSCGACHAKEIQANKHSLMATSAMLWGGAGYNNGIVPYKNYILGEAYTSDGQSAEIMSPTPVTPAMKKKGILSSLLPMPRWEVTPAADIFRVFERGGRVINSQFPDIGDPNATGSLQKLDEDGRPDIHQSNRGLGTGLRIAIPVLNIHKTRLNDPYMWFMGTNDNPGDFRNSGCAGCHVIYSNDKDPLHSGPYAKFGHDGTSASVDPTIPHHEPGHPLQHVFTRSIPSSQCMVCHMHQPNIFVNSFYGVTMWDYESDAPSMWPKQQKYPTDSEIHAINARNPEGAAPRGNWSDPSFLSHVSDLNPTLKDTQFADYHGHGWNFRAIFKRDRHGDLLDAKGDKVSNDDPQKFKKAVHLVSIHMEKGMQCMDCHFEQDTHGNGYLYGEASAAIEIQCVDCHGTVDKYPTLHSSGPAAQPGGRDLATLRNEDGSLRFEWRGDRLYQRSAVTPGLEWQVKLVKDTVNPVSPYYNAKAARAKLMSMGTSMQWGPGVDATLRAHKDTNMMCITCHTSWTTSCGGCHLPIEANWKTPRLHFEGGETRNYATYNPEVARDDMFFLGKNSTVKGNIIAPVRSSSALVLSSTNINREHIYVQQQPISASGYSSQAFAPHYPHTERTTETKTCTDCHVSRSGDNNAIMAQTLLLGTNLINLVGYNAWLGEDNGIEAVRVTEWDEPQAVIGSYLHKYAYPDWYKAHQDKGQELQEAYHHNGGRTQCIQLKGEYVYSAGGDDGFRVYDVEAIANKDFSERIVTAPFSPLGHDTHVASKNATCVALPAAAQALNPIRNRSTLMTVDNQEQPIHPIYSYAFVTDAEEGLIAVNIETMADGEPRNNFLDRAMTWNENGVLTGARHITIAGTVFYITTDRGVIVLNMDDPLHPKLMTTIAIPQARATALQFRYLFVTAADGLHIVDVTHPDQPRIVPGAMLPLRDARKIYVARTYAYVADGADGLAIVNVEKPEQPVLYQLFNAGGRITDATDVVVGSTNASQFAYVADGEAGLKVIQLISPASQPNFYGFAAEPKPELIAWRKTSSPALALSKGIDRDRAVDETGHQMAVFGRLGSRPFNLPEMQKLYLDRKGALWTVEDDLKMNEFLGPRTTASSSVPSDLETVRRPGS